MRIKSRLCKAQPVTSLKQEVYEAQAHFYQDEQGDVFGSFAFTQGCLTRFPIHPEYAIDNKRILHYKMLFISYPEGEVLGSMDYFQALDFLTAFRLDGDEHNILVKGIKKEEMLQILQQG